MTSSSVLPLEIFEQIVSWLEYESDINALARTHRAFYHFGNPMLYRHNVRHGKGSALGWGVQHGILATVQRAFEAGASAEKCGDAEIEWRPMALAVVEGHEDIVWYLYEHCRVNIRRTWGWMNPCHERYGKYPGSLLLLAAQNGHESLVRFFVNHLPRPYHVDHPADPGEGTPLMAAAKGGHLAIVHLLVEAGANLEVQNRSQMTPLMLAAAHGHLQVLQFLMQQGADPTVTQPNGCSALCWAAGRGHVESVRCLLEEDVITRLTCHTLGPSARHHAAICPLGWSGWLRHDEVVALLLKKWDYAARTSHPSDKGVLLCVAAGLGYTALIRDLLENHEYDPNARLSLIRTRWDELPTALCWAAARARVEVVEVLLAHDAEVLPAQTREYRNPFIQAIVHGSDAMVSLFLRAGVNPNDQDRSHNLDHLVAPALKHAIPFESIFRRLLVAGADPTAVDSMKYSVIAHVLRSGRTVVVQMLIDEDLDLSLHLTRSNLLHEAVRGGRAVLELLLNTGKWDSLLSPGHLDPSICEKALGIAAETAQVEALQWLLDRGFLPVRGAQSPPPKVHLLSLAALTKAADEDAAATLDLLLQAGLDIDETIAYKTALQSVARHYNLFGESERFRVRSRMLLERGATLLPPQSLPQATRYDTLSGFNIRLIGQHPELDVMIFQELEARREPWSVVKHLFRWADHRARERQNWKHVRVITQHSWRLRYPV
ncbi:ankyrin [Aspergillus aculeatinus CBS 121060]|uniref:Ankyrin n=1 Tax=Aspergillus aculeatinus CBS 121060 TaxID=1448322 RepID=A0ACD1GWS4_9EURO|nr:ankyrin [Aspergillus aculeatinus CBS 121060]RAH65581.1 ankyrin [Aspergillus aculeatinus CBS 121060]